MAFRHLIFVLTDEFLKGGHYYTNEPAEINELLTHSNRGGQNEGLYGPRFFQ
jgi:hypothetical protein